jgi:hypothetical protein
MSALVLCGGVDAHDEREAFAADHGAKGQHGATGAGRFSRVPGTTVAAPGGGGCAASAKWLDS